MILPDFTGIEHNHINQTDHKPQTSNRPSQQKLSNPSSSSSRLITTTSNPNNKINPKSNINAMDRYINQLNIPGVRQAYSQKQIQKQNLLHQTMLNQRQQHLNQSIQRLHSTGFNWKKTKKNKQQSKENSPQQQHDEHLAEHHQPQPYYNQLYQLDQKFDHQFRVKKLQNQCKQLYRELFFKFINKYQIWVAEDQHDKTIKQYKKLSLKQSDPKAKMTVIVKLIVQQMFVKSLVTFIINGYNSAPNNDNIKKTNFLSPQDEFTISYSDFLNHHKRRQWTKQQLNTSVSYNHQLTQRLKSLSFSLPFIYYFLSFDRLQKQDDGKLKNVGDVQVKVLEWLRKQQYQWEAIYQVFAIKLEPKFTVPFQTKLYQVKRLQQNKINNDQEEQIQAFQPFKANPIPQSTYQKPPSPSIQTKKSPTQPQPFNFTQLHPTVPPKTADEYYSWNRNFKANPIPNTLYQPQQIGLPQKQKQLLATGHKQRLYNQSKFPKTMSYLDNFNQFQQVRIKQLQQKYTQDRLQNKSKPKQIPNFQKMHKRDMRLLQTRKEANRSNTQPKPFKFTQTKKTDTRNMLKNTLIINEFEFAQSYQKQNSNKMKSFKDTSSIPAAKTTAKFDAYVQLRKQQKQQKQNQKQQKKLHKKRQQQDKRRYKEILKQRMQNQLSQQPKSIQYYGNNNNNNNTTNNIVKVDLQQIYLERPLLMSKSQKPNNNKRKNNDDTKTCFTDNYQPII